MGRRRNHLTPLHEKLARWRNQHDRKQLHTDPNEAANHRDRLNANSPSRFHVYECRWGDAFELGEIGELHWHVGREPTVSPRGKGS